MELFRLDPGLAFWTWVAFGVLFFLLWKYVFPSMIGAIKKRESLIAKSVDDASEIQKRLDSMNDEYEKVMEKAKGEAAELLRNARREADVLKKKLLEKAEAEAAELLAQAQARMAEEREAFFRSLQKELADFVCDTSEKVIGTSFVTEKDKEWTRELVKTL